MNINRVISIGALVAVLGGCASYKLAWNHGGYFTDTESSAFRFSGGNRDFRTSIIGNPFDAPKSETERSVLDAMKGQDKGLNANFTTQPRTHYKNNRIVMMFNPPKYHADKGACATSSDYAGQNKGGEMVLAALYCDGDRLVYAVAISRAAIKSPQDPQFRKFVIELMDFFVPQHSMAGDPGNNGD